MTNVVRLSYLGLAAFGTVSVYGVLGLNAAAGVGVFFLLLGGAGAIVLNCLIGALG